jgi:hypothetical protein
MEDMAGYFGFWRFSELHIENRIIVMEHPSILVILFIKAFHARARTFPPRSTNLWAALALSPNLPTPFCISESVPRPRSSEILIFSLPQS